MTPPTRPVPDEPPTGDFARWIATVLSDDAPAPQRAAAEEALRASDAGRRLLEALATFDPPSGEPGEDEARVARIMAAVSTLDAADLRRVAEAVLDAWGDPAFRESLRRDPAAALAARGVAVPAGMALRVVGPGEAAALSATRTDLPLPPAGAPAVGRAEARAALVASGFALLDGAAGLAGRRGAGAPIPWAGRHARRIAAWGALAALVALALVTARGALLGGGSLSGSAIDTPGTASGAPDVALGMPAAAALVVAGAIVAVALAWWLRRR